MASSRLQSARTASTDIAGSATQPRFATVSADLNTAFQDALIGVATGAVSPEDALASLQAVVDKG